jgi:hypothetical protein
MANKQDFTDELNRILIQAKEDKKDSVEILSKDLHDSVASKEENSMPNCCNAMKDLEKINFSKMEVIDTTDSGQSTTIKIRYTL